MQGQAQFMRTQSCIMPLQHTTQSGLHLFLGFLSSIAEPVDAPAELVCAPVHVVLCLVGNLPVLALVARHWRCESATDVAQAANNSIPETITEHVFSKEGKDPSLPWVARYLTYCQSYCRLMCPSRQGTSCRTSLAISAEQVAE